MMRGWCDLGLGDRFYEYISPLQNLSKPEYNTCNLVKARSYIKMNKFMVNLLTPSTLVGRPIVNSTNTHQWTNFPNNLVYAHNIGKLTLNNIGKLTRLLMWFCKKLFLKIVYNTYIIIY